MMRATFSLAVAALLPSIFPTTAMADAAPAPACAAIVAPTGELAPWTSPKPLAAAGGARRMPTLAPGQAVTVRLLRTPQVRYPLAPEKPGSPASNGGLIALDVAEAATYRVALGSAAWIDLVRDGAAVTSVAHGHGPACSSVRKIVDFPLSRGRYTLQLAASGEPQTTLLVARLP